MPTRGFLGDPLPIQLLLTHSPKVPVELIGVGRVLTAAIGHLRGLQHIGMSMGVPNGADWDRTVIEQFGRLKEVYHRAAMVF